MGAMKIFCHRKEQTIKQRNVSEMGREYLTIDLLCFCLNKFVLFILKKGLYAMMDDFK